jgi:beta-lactamase class A
MRFLAPTGLERRSGIPLRHYGRVASVILAVAVGFLTVNGETGASASHVHASESLPRFSTTGSAVIPLGGAPNLGSLSGTTVNASVVAVASTVDRNGYWLAGADGGVFCFGDAPFEGSLSAVTLSRPIVGMAATPDGNGYWLVAADGGVFALGNAHFDGSLGGVPLNQPVVGIVATPDGGGYWLVAADGGIFTFGDAAFDGSLGGVAIRQPVRGMAATADGRGYWLVAADGGVFAFGAAPFEGSLGSSLLASPVVGISSTLDGGGYWLVGADGGVFAFGDAPFEGSLSGQVLAQPVIGLAPSVSGYWLAEGQLTHSPFTPAIITDLNNAPGLVSAAVEDLTTGDVFVYHPNLRLITASILKVQLLGTVLSEARAASQPLSPSEQALVAPMIEVSDNHATTNLLQDAGGPGAVATFDQSIGMTESNPISDWGNSTTTATDQLTLLDRFVQPNGYLSDASRTYGLNLMSQIVPADIFGVSSGVPSGLLRASKTGRIPSEGVINGIGWVQGQGRDYLIAVLTQGVRNPDQTGLALIDEVSTSTWNALNP